MTNDELKEYMKERLDMQDKALQELKDTLAPIKSEQDEMRGTIKALKYLVGIGFAAVGVIIALLELVNK